jgi:cytochrome c oxidase subunit I+III
MTPVQTIDVSELQSYEISTQAPLWWGQLLLAVIEGTMFSIVLASFLYVRMRVDVWPPPGDQFPHTFLPSLSMLLLLLSCIPSYWASEAAKKNHWAGMVGGLFLNLVLAGGALVLRIVEWHSFNFNWKTDIFGSYAWGLLGLHTFDYIADLVFTSVLIVILLFGKNDPKQRLGVHVDSIVWYFIVGIWIPSYILLYWGPWFLSSQQ